MDAGQVDDWMMGGWKDARKKGRWMIDGQAKGRMKRGQKINLKIQWLTGVNENGLNVLQYKYSRLSLRCVGKN